MDANMFKDLIEMHADVEKNSNLSDCMTKILGDVNFHMVQHLSLKNRELMSLPENFGYCLINLKQLDLSGNKLKNLPHSLKSLKNLERLNIDDNSLCYLPPNVTKITSLKELEASNNRMTSLPSDIAELRSLEILTLRHNKLTKLPFSCEKMERLETLDLSGNCLKCIPHCINVGMRNLKKLNLSCNSCIDLSLKPASKRLKELRVRDAGNNVKFPHWIFTGGAPNLELLDLDNTTFEIFDFPNDEWIPLRIKLLSIQQCCLYDSFLENFIRHADELVTLRAGNEKPQFSGNSFWEMRIDALKNPAKVHEIDFKSTGLSAISTNIDNFTNLVVLNCARNNIDRLPDEICRLKKLEVLAIDENRLLSLPSDIGCLISLKELRICGNNLSSLPESLASLHDLAYLDLYYNDFREIPEVLKRLENLIGLDMDQNLISAENLRIGDKEYDILRKSLRNLCNDIEYKRETGPRDATDSEEQLSVYSEDRSSSDSWNRDYDAEPAKSVSDRSEENWDLSENSADEYDATCDNNYSRKKPPGEVSYVTTASRGIVCYPAKFHPLPIKQQIAELQEKGLFHNYSDSEIEGQFDDA